MKVHYRAHQRVGYAQLLILKDFVLFVDQRLTQKRKKKSKNARDLISCVSTINFKDNILELPDKKGDDVLKTVKKRISFEIDLVAAEARYHRNFRKLHNPGTGEKKGRPKNNNINAAMENVFSYIENHKDCQFTHLN